MKKIIFLLIIWFPALSPLIAQNTINAYEYWYDDGFSNRTNITVSQPVTTLDLDYNMDVSSLSMGFHKIYFRFQDNNGKWSVPLNHQFYRLTNPVNDTASYLRIVEYEYWLDENYDTRVNVAVNPSGSTYALDMFLNADTLSIGLHKLYFRFKDNIGNWSVVTHHIFYKLSEAVNDTVTYNRVIAYQYWLDTDFANRVTVSTTPMTNILSLDTNLDMSSITEGNHTLYIRFQDGTGNWSVPIWESFFKAYTTAIDTGVCNGDTYNLGGNLYSTTGTYIDTLIAYGGGDSIVTLNLTILPSQVTTLNANLCQGQTYTVGSSVYSTTGTYTDTLQTWQGCDSTVTLNLTVNSTSSTTLNESICQGQTYTVGSSVYSTTGTYIDTLQTWQGCDSTVTLNLTINSTPSTTLNESICQGQTYTVGSSVYSTTGIYIDTLQTWQGCDSIIFLNLTILPNLTETINANICQGETYEGYTSTGTYIDTLIASNGCDSFRTIILNIDTLPIPIITSNGVTLESSLANSYQWYLNGVILTDSISQSITPSQNGLYMIEVTDANGCLGTNTLDFTVSISWINGQKINIIIAPNPNNGQFRLETENLPTGNWNIDIQNIKGQLIQSQRQVINESNTQIPIVLQNISKGVYLLRMTNVNGLTITKKFLIK